MGERLIISSIRGFALAVLAFVTWALGVFSYPALASSNDMGNPYSVISERNIFRLNPPPPPPEPDKGPPPAVPDVYLTGFVRTGDRWKVYLMTKVENPDPHGGPLSVYLNLAEGEKQKVGSGAKQSELELVKVYAELEKVDIVNAGTRMTLTKENAIASAPTASAAATPRKGVLGNRRTPVAPPMPAMPTPPPISAAEGEKENVPPRGIAPVGGAPPPAIEAPPPIGREATNNSSSTIIIGGGGEEAPKP